MSRWYLDASAALKLILAEAESAALIAAINAERPVLAACSLLETEVRRAAQRSPDLTQRHATALLDRVDLYPPAPSLFAQAGLLPGEDLRPHDALHIAAAIVIGVECLVTYDARMAEAARDAGVPVKAPRALDR